jgi:hypothetical protein
MRIVKLTILFLVFLSQSALASASQEQAKARNGAAATKTSNAIAIGSTPSFNVNNNTTVLQATIQMPKAIEDILTKYQSSWIKKFAFDAAWKKELQEKVTANLTLRSKFAGGTVDDKNNALKEELFKMVDSNDMKVLKSEAGEKEISFDYVMNKALDSLQSSFVGTDINAFMTTVQDDLIKIQGGDAKNRINLLEGSFINNIAITTIGGDSLLGTEALSNTVNQAAVGAQNDINASDTVKVNGGSNYQIPQQ